MVVLFLHPEGVSFYLAQKNTLPRKAVGFLKGYKQASQSNRVVYRNWGCRGECPGPSLRELRVWGDPNTVCLDKEDQKGSKCSVIPSWAPFCSLSDVL